MIGNSFSWYSYWSPTFSPGNFTLDRSFACTSFPFLAVFISLESWSFRSQPWPKIWFPKNHSAECKAQPNLYLSPPVRTTMGMSTGISSLSSIFRRAGEPVKLTAALCSFFPLLLCSAPNFRWEGCDRKLFFHGFRSTAGLTILNFQQLPCGERRTIFSPLNSLILFVSNQIDKLPSILIYEPY